MPGKHVPQRRPTPICAAGRPVPAPSLHSIIGNLPRRRNRSPTPPSISPSICAHQGAQPASPYPICPFRPLAGRHRPHSPPKVPSARRPLSSRVCQRKTRKTIIGIGAIKPPRENPKSHPRPNQAIEKLGFVKFVLFVAFVTRKRSPQEPCPCPASEIGTIIESEKKQKNN